MQDSGHWCEQKGIKWEDVTGNVLVLKWDGRLKHVHFIMLHNLHTCEIHVFACTNISLK